MMVQQTSGTESLLSNCDIHIRGLAHRILRTTRQIPPRDKFVYLLVVSLQIADMRRRMDRRVSLIIFLPVAGLLKTPIR